MNLVRSVISFFLVILVVLAVAGWSWAGGQPSPKCEGARAALSLCGAMSIGSLVILWSAKQPEVTS